MLYYTDGWGNRRLLLRTMVCPIAEQEFLPSGKGFNVRLRNGQEVVVGGVDRAALMDFVADEGPKK